MAKITTDSQHYTNIANIIREKTHTTTTYKPEEMISGIEKVYEQGFQDGGAGQGGGSTNTPTITKVIAGNPVTLMDVSDIPHNISLQLTSDTITDFSNVYVKVNGKNLVNLNEAIIGKSLSGGGVGKIIAGATAASGAIIPYIRVQPNTTYTFSLDNSVYWLNRICQMDKNNNCTENHSFYTNTANDYSQYSIYTRSDTTWVALGLVKKSDNQIAALDELQAINLQFERKSYASNFEPYWEEIYQVNELGENDAIKSHFNDLNISIVDTISTSGQIQCQQQNILISVEYHQLYGAIIERENFWRAFQQGGARVDYSNAFQRYSADMFYPYYDIIPTNIGHGFYLAQIGNLKKILQDNNVILDTSKATSVDSAFRNSAISHLPVIDFTNATRAAYSFYYCQHLHTIDKLILSDKITAFDNMLTGCEKLQNIEIEGLIAGKNFHTNHSPLLSKESIISIINALSPTTTGLSIVFSHYAVKSAFGVDDEGNLSQEWYDLIEPKQQNWTISLV